MNRVCVYGVVKNGQVVLDVPLPLADGTIVTITDSEPSDIVSIGPQEAPPPEVTKQMMLALLKRPDLSNDPDWLTKVEENRVSVTENLILQMAGMWANRHGMADPEQWVRRLRGARE